MKPGRFAFAVFALILSPLFFDGNLPAQARHLVAFYNLENLFDTIDSPGVDDFEFTPRGEREWSPARYQFKIDQMARVISMIGNEHGLPGPAVIGICEVENVQVVRDLVNSSYLNHLGYSYVHFDSPDRRGIDVALLYRPAYFKVTSSRSVPVLIAREDGTRLFTRDQLVVSGIFDGEPMHFIVNHWPSRLGGELRSRPHRASAALVSRAIVDSILSVNSEAKIVLMGDLNDNPDDSSVRLFLRARYDQQRLRDGQLFNASGELYSRGEGSLKFQGNWSMLDQVILSEGFLSRRGGGYKFYMAGVFNEPFLIRQEGRFTGYPFRTFSGGEFIRGFSDHLPVYVIIGRD